MLDTKKMTQEELEHYTKLSGLSQEDLVELACEGDSMAQVMVTCSSANFATTHAQAVLFEEVMTQKFRVRIKSVPAQALHANRGESFSKIRRDFAEMGGKFFDCTIDWEHSKMLGNLFVKVEGGKHPDYIVSYEDLTKLTTVRKMKAMYDYFKSTNKW